jgi:hypothetical protein
VSIEAFIGEGPDIPGWESPVCEALVGHQSDYAWEGPETLAFGYSAALHETVKPTSDAEE